VVFYDGICELTKHANVEKLLCAARKLLAFNLKSLNNNASALIEARSRSAGVRSALKNV
jgi:hypothetical protein